MNALAFEAWEAAGVKVLELAATGERLDPRDVTDVIGEALGVGAGVAAMPLSRLPDGFLDLKTRIAGEWLQKLVTYELRAAVMGDASAEIARSEVLAAFVRESNRGRHVWFVRDRAELEAKLQAG
jgi:hypothetical protein